MLYGFRERIAKLLKVFLIQEDLVLFVLFLSDPLAFRYRDIEVFFRFRRLDIKEIRALSRADTFGENFIFVGIFQRTNLPIR